MPEFEETFEDPIIECDPEAAAQPLAPEGRYTNSEHGARGYTWGVRTFDTKRGPRTYFDICVIIPDVPGVGTVFARSQAFGKFHTCTQKNTGSLAPIFAKQCNMSGKPASNFEQMPVTVDVGIREYETEEGTMTTNYIKNIWAE